MKLFSKIILVVLIAGLFSSCTQRRYGQLTGFQWNKKDKTEKVVQKRSGHYVKIVDQANKNVQPKFDVKNETESIVLRDFTSQENSTNSIASSDRKTANTLKKKHANPLDALQKNPVTIGTNPIDKIKRAKSAIKNQKNDQKLLYIILVVILILLVISLLEKVLGPWLSGIIILILLIFLILYLLGNL